MADFAITSNGGNQLLRYLEKLEPKLVKKDLRKATRAAAKAILPDVKRLVPRGETKRLLKSLKVRAAKGNKGQRLPRHIVGHSVVSSANLFVGDTFYAGVLEFGTKPRRSKKTGAYRGRVPETSFLRKALHKNRKEIKTIVKRELIKGLNETARQAGMPR